MIISNKKEIRPENQLQIYFKKTGIESTTSHKYLGLIFQNNFKWTLHIDFWFRSCSIRLALMRK